MKRRWQVCKKPKVVADCNKTVFSGHSREIAVGAHSSGNSVHKTCANLSKTNASVEKRRRYEIPPLAEELSASNRCCEMKSHFTLKTW